MVAALTKEEAALEDRLAEDVSDYEMVTRLSRRIGIHPGKVRGPSRLQEDVEKRRRIALVLRAAGWSYPRIGRALGNRNHATVIWLCRGGRKKRCE